MTEQSNALGQSLRERKQRNVYMVFGGEFETFVISWYDYHLAFHEDQSVTD